MVSFTETPGEFAEKLERIDVTIGVVQRYEARELAEEAKEAFERRTPYSVRIEENEDEFRGTIFYTVIVDTSKKALSIEELREIEEAYGNKKRLFSLSDEGIAPPLTVRFRLEEQLNLDGIGFIVGNRVNMEKMQQAGGTMVDMMEDVGDIMAEDTQTTGPDIVSARMRREGALEWSLGIAQKVGIDTVGESLNNMEQIERLLSPQYVFLTIKESQI